MVVISGKDISKAYGTDIITEDVCFGVEKGDKVGIVGANGCGKSTLMGIIAGDIEPTSGEIYIRRDFSLAHLKQSNIFMGRGSVIEEASKSFSHFYEMEARIKSFEALISDHESADFEKNLAEYTELMDSYEKKGGYTYKSELSATLKAMGFSEEDMGKSTDKLSGGERTRLALSCILLRKPDILMLDEPTNHLDLGMLDWLESYLSNYKGTLLVVSHDRYFLDRIVTRIFDMNEGRLDSYSGNYSEFLIKKAERMEALMREYEKQHEEIARQEEMIRRFKQHGTEHLAKRARSREKRLAMVERIEKPRIRQGKMKLSLEADFKSGGEVLTAEGLSKSFGERRLFSGVDMLIRKGERVCIIGDNGIGKTTLLKILIGLEKADEGYLKAGYNVDFGYYDQGQLLLDENESVLGEMKNAYRLYTDTEMRSLLGRFLFFGDDVFKKVRDLSGGEKAKLSLLKLMLSGANTLVLDEPTNHLDIESREIVEDALLEFAGTLIIVSHDRYLLSKIPDRIFELSENGLREYKGNFEYYMEKSGKGRALDSPAGEKASDERREVERTLEIVRDSEISRQEKKKAEAEERRRERRRSAVEERIHELESLLTDLQDEINSGQGEADHEWLGEKARLMAEYEEEIAALYDEWIELQE
ncbi:MAG: ABC-F family ATP-binding cassette domain-containing protein [Mogibacterium sp.]|nr:ABC-F family ATP-binding cassette domain-containing protein [Mogibacterium sp.]